MTEDDIRQYDIETILGLVAIVGRPNVGKSTLFNQMTRTRRAIVDDLPGVTRDRLYGTVHPPGSMDNSAFTLIDTGGFETDDLSYQPFSDNLVWQQTELAIEEADYVLLVFDGKSGIHQHDKELLRYLQKHEKSFLCLVNKVDGLEQDKALWDFYELGVDTLIPVSAAHNRGVREVADLVAEEIIKIPGLDSRKNRSDATRIAIIGRPNAGKSSILNRLLGEERALVSEVAGTTRDTHDTAMNYNSKPYVLVDTAGIRRRAKISSRLESLSVIMSMKAVEGADIILLILDAAQGLTDQDARLADLAVSRHKPLVLVVNKWDLIPEKDSNTPRDYAKDLRDVLREMEYVPVIFVSCLKNQRIHKLMSLVEKLAEAYSKRITTGILNQTLETIVQEHTPALIRSHAKRIKFYYATQVRTRPPTIVVFCNVAGEIQESYKRYMRRRFRKALGFDEIPLRVLFRGRDQERLEEE